MQRRGCKPPSIGGLKALRTKNTDPKPRERERGNPLGGRILVVVVRRGYQGYVLIDQRKRDSLRAWACQARESVSTCRISRGRHSEVRANPTTLRSPKNLLDTRGLRITGTRRGHISNRRYLGTASSVRGSPGRNRQGSRIFCDSTKAGPGGCGRLYYKFTSLRAGSKLG